MDSRRVAKAYRDRSLRAKVLPYPTPTGLLSKVKRYFSGPAAAPKPSESSSQTRYASDQSNSYPSLPASVNTSLVNNSADQADSNRILSSFFQEKGSDPLSQVEYEGVLSLMERSRANISMADTSSAPANHDLSQQSQSRRNSQYTQRMLRNSSLHDANNSSYVAPDYKPVYHTFGENSPNVSRSSNVSMKRVYQFSGLPSPYRTRIKVPNTAARQTKRISAKLPVDPMPETTANSTLESTSSFKPKSKTAHTLMSILDGNSAETTPTAPAPAARPLHNPYLKGKRLLSSYSSDAPPAKKPTTTADDIAKTVSYTNVEALSEDKGPPLFDRATSTNEDQISATKAGASYDAADLETKANGSDKAPPASKTTEEPKNTFTFGSKATEQPRPAFSFGSTTSEPSAPAFSFGATKNTQSSETKPSFSFGKPIASDVPKDKGAPAPVLNFGASGSSKSGDTKPAFGIKPADSTSTFSLGSKPDQAPSTFNFGPKSSESTENPESTVTEKAGTKSTPAFSFGAKPAAAPKLFNFGAKPDVPATEEKQGSVDATSKTESEKPEPFSFGANTASSSETKPVFTFGAKTSETPAASEKSSTESKPLFSFGSKSAEPKPSFSFGSKPTESASEEAKPAFNFGAKAEESKPFTFGKPAESKPFTFGKQAEPKPFSFGKQTEGPQSTSLNHSTEKSSSDAKPGFSFESSTSTAKPVFSFGTKPSTKDTSTEAPKTAFNFGQTTDASKPAFSFGKSEETQKPAFNFGQSTETAKPAFNFGSSSSSNGTNGPNGINGSNGTTGSNGNTGISGFQFPSVEVREVALDESKVKEYEKIFEFS